MRKLTDHIVDGDQAVQLDIAVTDYPGSGGANHRYEITGFDTKANPSGTDRDGYRYAANFARLLVLFQNGPIKEFGVNGITGEALLAIQIDRLRCFQGGPFACNANGRALWHCEVALAALQERTMERIARGVEGTHKQ